MAGNLCVYDENGKLEFTNATETYRGLKDSFYIYHGEWSDPEIWYNDHLYNYYDVEDMLWDMYKEECNELGKQANEDKFDTWADNQDLYSFFMDLEFGECYTV